MVFNKLKSIISEEFDIDVEDITLESSFLNDFGFDELDMYDLVMSCEDAFDKEIPDEALQKIVTVGDLVKFIEEN